MRTRLLPIVAVLGALLGALAAPAATLAVDPPKPAFGGPLDGGQEVPAVVTAATGEGTAVLSADESTITYFVTYSGLSGALAAAHIHTGAAGIAGGVILPLVVTASPMVGTLTAADFGASGSITTFAQAIAAIKAGETYFNLHTAANPGGEIRAQILAKGNAFFATIAGAQEVPAVTTSASGNGWALVSTDGSTVTYFVAYAGLSGALAASHIHTGAAGVAGGVILPLVVTASPMVGTLTAANFTASGSITTFAQAVAAIAAGNTYFNLHTAANPGGEIRGQIGGLPAPQATPTAPTTSTAPESAAQLSTPPDLAVILTVLLAIVAWSALTLNLVRRRVRATR